MNDNRGNVASNEKRKNAMKNEQDYAVLDSNDVVTLDDADLGLILGGNASDVTGSSSANWENSGSYRDAAVQMAGAVGGVVVAGLGIVTAPVSFPVALGAALAAAAIGGFAAADAQMDMRAAKPD